MEIGYILIIVVLAMAVMVLLFYLLSLRSSLKEAERDSAYPLPSYSPKRWAAASRRNTRKEN